MGRGLLRFDLPVAAEVAGLTGPATSIHRLVGRPPVESTATVIDTADHRLLSWGLELSRVAETGRWTLRAAGWEPLLNAERTMPQAEDDIPQEFAGLLVPFRRGGILGPSLEVASVRRRFTLTDESGRPFGDLTDERVRIGHHPGQLRAFRCVTLQTPDELEPDIRDAVVAAFAAAGGTRVKNLPTLATRLGLTSHADRGARLSARTPIEDFVSAHLQARWRGLLRADLAVRTTGRDDAELRAGVRLLRQELAALGPLLTADWLGSARRLLDAALADPRTLQNTERWLRILDLLADGVAEPPLLPHVAGRITGPVLAQEIEAVVRTMRDQCRTLDPYSDDVRWVQAHEVANRAWALSTLSCDVFGKPARRLRKRLTAIATALHRTVRPEPSSLARDLHDLTATEIFEAGRAYERAMLSVDYAREQFLREWPLLWDNLRARVIRPRVPHQRAPLTEAVVP
ncbi:MAG: hypothetical protein QM619_00095 [Micropruina sp.]|uniref:hypothetical protein n=1 Tax=Micropruina sp. TaxID=2737536 RepID=UPI0039E6E4FD